MNSENILLLELKYGLVKILTYPEIAPSHVNQIKMLTKGGFYDGLKWHRVIDGFMAQTGCPFGTGFGGINYAIKPEFSDKKHRRGTCSMARSENPNSASSQFFICFQDAPHLDKNYTVWGEVIEGMEFVDQIKKGQLPSGSVQDPDIILKMSIQSN